MFKTYCAELVCCVGHMVYVLGVFVTLSRPRLCHSGRSMCPHGGKKKKGHLYLFTHLYIFHLLCFLAN